MTRLFPVERPTFPGRSLLKIIDHHPLDSLNRLTTPTMSLRTALKSSTNAVRSLRSPRYLHTSSSLRSSRQADPFPLPLSDPALAAQASRVPNPTGLSENSEEWPMPQPLDRSGEDEKTLRARLVYQTRKRGTLESDLLLSTFARDALPSMKVEQMKEFDKVGRRAHAFAAALE